MYNQVGVIYSTPKHCYTRLLTVRGTGDTENPLEMHVWSKCSLDRNEIKSLPKHVAKSEFLEMNKKQFLCECTCCLWRILKEKFQNLSRTLVRVTLAETSPGLVWRLLHLVVLSERAQNYYYFTNFDLCDSKIGHREMIEDPVWKSK